MNLRLFILYITVLFVTLGCSTTKRPPEADPESLLLVRNDRTTYRKPVTFEIFNKSLETVLVASTYHLFIERYNSEYKKWERLPYRPCRCIGPCPSPSTVNLEAGATISITWDRYQVTCNGEASQNEDPTEEVFQKKGLYRMKFRYTPIVNGRKTNSEELVFEFRLR